MAKHLKRDPAAFDAWWDGTIMPWYQKHAAEPGISMPNQQDAHDRVREAYNYLNEYCTDVYMEEGDPLLNQRKVATCLAYALVAAKPIDVDLDAPGCMQPAIEGKRGSIPALANERLAIATAVTVIERYVECAVNDTRLCRLSDERRVVASRDAARGIDLLDEVDGGEWLLNLERSLGFTAIEGNYNIPILSCLMAYLESTILAHEDYVEVLRAFERAAGDTA